jgi:hypothetical protein
MHSSRDEMLDFVQITSPAEVYGYISTAAFAYYPFWPV